MADPYFQFKNEIERSLEHVSTLHASYLRILRTVPSEQHAASTEIKEAQRELAQTLDTLAADVDELAETVNALRNPAIAERLHISQAQILERRQFVDRVKGELKAVQISLSSTSPDFAVGAKQKAPAQKPSLPVIQDVGEATDQDAFEMQHQTLLMHQQDRTLTEISGTVNLLREQARLMGSEVVDQNKLLYELDEHVDMTASRLERAQKKMNKFIRDNKNSPSSWCVLILMIVLSVLLFIIVFL